MEKERKAVRILPDGKAFLFNDDELDKMIGRVVMEMDENVIEVRIKKDSPRNAENQLNTKS